MLVVKCCLLLLLLLLLLRLQEQYSKSFHNLVEQHKFVPIQIYSANESGLFWWCLPNSTVAFTSEKNAEGFKLNTGRITILV
jgi:hypothetical protein